MLPLSALEFIGGAIFTTNGGGAPVAIAQSNCSLAAAGAGAGDLTITLGEGGVDRAQAVIFAACVDATATLGPQVVHTSDTAKQILTFDDAGVAADRTSSVFFFRRTGVAGPFSGSNPHASVGALPAGTALQYLGGCTLTTNGAGAPTIIAQDNVTIPALGTGIGDITIVLGDGGADANEIVYALWSDSNAVDTTPHVVHTSDTQKQILLVDNTGAPIDGTFGFYVFKPNVGGLYTP